MMMSETRSLLFTHTFNQIKHFSIFIYFFLNNNLSLKHTKSLLIIQRNLPCHWTEVYYCFAPNTLIREKGLPVLPVQISSSKCCIFSPVTIDMQALLLYWSRICLMTDALLYHHYYHQRIICSKHKVGVEAYTASRFIQCGYISICTTSLSHLLTTLHKGSPCRHRLTSTLHM